MRKVLSSVFGKNVVIIMSSEKDLLEEGGRAYA